MADGLVIDEVFDRRVIYPDSSYRDRFARLIGIDEQKERLINILSLFVNPDGLIAWGEKHYKGGEKLIEMVLRRPPLVVLEGDVGSGKTELAESVGDTVARGQKIPITLYPLSLATRGKGLVGEMTTLLSAAFDLAVEEAKRLKGSKGPARGGIIMLVDEADALAQSREAAQMHHEDRAGVNAFIRGVDRMGEGQLPIAIVMCTNRLGALDPAVRRRAADILTFGRPNDNQRREVLAQLFTPLGWSSAQIEELVSITGKGNGRSYGFTFSDLTQRLIPRIVLDAYPLSPITSERAIAVARNVSPTPPFQERGG